MAGLSSSTVPSTASPRQRLRRRLALLTAALTTLVGLPSPALADPASPISVSVVATPSPVASGAEITYAITMTNTGSASLSGLVMTDQLNGVGTLQSPPAAPQYAITSTQGTCTQSAQKVACNGGSMAGRATWTVTIRGLVTAPQGTTINNTATVTGTKSAQNFTTNGSTQTLVTGSGPGGLVPDLSINKSGPTSVVAGSGFDYLLTVNNIGSAGASGVVVWDTLPPNVTLQSPAFLTTSLFTCASNAPANPVKVTCSGGSVNAGQNATITIKVKAPAGGPLTNTAVVDPDNLIAETNELNNTSAVVNTAVTAADPPPSLTIIKTDDPAVIAGAGPDPVVPMGTLTYKIRVTNTSTTRADDVMVVDGTQGLDAASIVATQVIVNGALGTGNGCTVVAPEVRCRIRSLNAGGTLTVTIVGTVIAPSGTTILNTATATANIKNVGVTARATESTTVKPQYDLTITKAGAPDPVCARSWPAAGQQAADPDVCVGGLEYTFVVGNSGVSPTPLVTVRDVLPAGTIYDGFANIGGDDFACILGTGNVLTCTNPSIGAEATESFSIIVVPPSSTGSLTNTASVDPGNAIFESDETNNVASATVAVTTGIDLTVFKQDKAGDTPIDPPGTLIPNYPSPTEGFDPIATNGTQTYTIYVDNLGTQNASNVRVADTLPAGTRFLSVTGNAGFTCSHDGSATGGKVTCVGGSLDGTAKEIYAKYPGGPTGNQFATIKIKLFATGFVQPAMHNEVRVDPLNAIDEANEDNNIAFQDTVVQTGGATKGAFNQLTVAKVQSDPATGGVADPVAQNGTLKYTITVGNDGTDPVSNVTLKDFLPTGSRFISAVDTDPGPGTTDAFLCTHDGAATGGTVTCTGGDFSGTVNTIPDTGGAGNVPLSRQVVITVFAPNPPGTYQNTVKVDPDDVVPEGNEFDNTAQATTVVKTAGDGGKNSYNQLTITKVATPEVATNSIITWTLTVTNAGTDPAFGVAVRDTLPAGTSFISATDNSPGANQFTCTYSGGVVDCVGATLSGLVNTTNGAPSFRTITIKAFSPNRPMVVTNTAFVDPDNTIPEGDETDNHSSADTSVTVGAGFIDLSVKKCDVPIDGTCAGDVRSWKSGDTITYNVEVTNQGTDPAFQVVVRDPVPAGMTIVSAQDSTGGPGGFTCDVAGQVVTCSGGTLDGSLDLVPGVGQTRTILITVTAPQVRSQTFTNQAVVDPGNTIPESNETNNQASDKSRVNSPFNLKLDKDGPTTAQQNNTEDYVLTVTNLGDSVDDVLVTDPLPVGLIPLGVVAEGTSGGASNMACQVLENPVNVVSCVGDMPAGQVLTITVHVFITQDGGKIDNEACVDPNNTIVESDESDNCSTKTTQIRKFSPNISVQKSASSSSVSRGETLTYTVTVSNTGDAKSTAFDITDDLPGVLSIIGTPVATNGVTCTHDGAATGGTVTCPVTGGLSPGATTTVTIQARVTNAATSSFTNTAKANGGNAVSVDTSDSVCQPDPSSACEDETATNVTNNTDSVTTSVGGSAIDLVVGDISDATDPVATGDQAIYTVTVTNAGSQDAKASEGHQVVVRLDLPTTGMTLNSVLASQGFTCTQTNADAVSTCVGDLLAGQSTTITAKLTVEANAPNLLTVKVTADPADAILETDEANNTDTEVTSVTHTQCTQCIDLQAGQVIATPNPVVNDHDLTYQFVVTNIGDQSTATGDGTDHEVVIAVNLDTSFNESTFVSATATNGFTCGLNPAFGTGIGQLPTNPEVLCTAGPSGELAAGAGTTVTVVAHADTASVPSFVDFDVTVDPGDRIHPEYSDSNNTSSLQVSTVAP